MVMHDAVKKSSYLFAEVGS